jgi:predicted NAD/FAD-binding protein
VENRSRKVAVIGGGASGASLLWCLTRQPRSRDAWRATLFHDEDELGGHSRTIPIRFDASGKAHVAAKGDPGPVHPVDIGVQFVCPTLYPNLYRQLRLPEFAKVGLTRHPSLRLSGAFNDDIVWGNFADYQRGDRFSRCWDSTTRMEALRFQRDMQRAPLVRIGGDRIANMRVGEYLARAGYRRDGHFFRYMLIPYLCIINGYGTVDLLETTVMDLYPIFARLPLVQDAGPYTRFTDPGHGWDRFTDGATTWVKTMGDYAEARGATVRLGTYVERVARRGEQWIVRFREGASWGEGGRELPAGSVVHEEAFDAVVFTTDMQVNSELLDHDANPWRSLHREFLSTDKFKLLPGVCYIHQDGSLLAPSLADGREDGQFTSYFAWGERDEGAELYDLPYGLASSFQTYFMDNIMGTPAPCYVSMYAEDTTARVPDPALTVFRRTWRHGRWVASFFREAKRRLHRAQGVGNLWFAGNNTTVDSEEGALLSAMIVAARFAGVRYPFERGSLAWAMHGWFFEQMFPARSMRHRVVRLLGAAEPRL